MAAHGRAKYLQTSKLIQASNEAVRFRHLNEERTARRKGANSQITRAIPWQTKVALVDTLAQPQRLHAATLVARYVHSFRRLQLSWMPS
jgi:hypothetical protein